MKRFATRPFEYTDYPMVYTWWMAHNSPPVPADLLPVYGLVAGECLAGWIYFDTSTPVCFASHLVSKPGISWSTATRASEALFDTARDHALHAGYTVMLLFAPLAVARHARKMGFSEDTRELRNLAIQLKEEQCQSSQ